MEVLPFLVPLALAALVFVAIRRFKRGRADQHDRARATWATGRGWHYLGEGPPLTDQVHGLPFDRGTGRRTRWVTRAIIDGVEVTTGIHEYSVRRNQSDALMQHPFASTPAPAWPRTILVPGGGGSDGIGVDTDSPNYLEQLLTPGVREALRDCEGFIVAIDAGRLLITSREYLADASVGLEGWMRARGAVVPDTTHTYDDYSVMIDGLVARLLRLRRAITAA